jgi:hypothetical protein
LLLTQVRSSDAKLLNKRGLIFQVVWIGRQIEGFGDNGFAS